MMARLRVVALMVVSVSAMSHAQAAPAASDVPKWAFPGSSADLKVAKPPFDSLTLLRLPNSVRAFTMAQVKNTFAPPDWYPESHARMPESVAHGRPGVVWACGYCHLPDGQGRAENATIAGLPASYIVSQVAAIRARTRQAAVDGWGPSVRMTDAADSITDADLAQAAQYFSRMKAKPRFKVVERSEVPTTYEAGGLYAVRPGSDKEALGHRIIEITEDLERHELRDAATTFTAYVPPGSVAAGRKIASAPSKNPVKTCTTCHGPSLLGVGVVPPLAGRSPTYLFRQLYGFKTGHRAGAASAPMQAAVSKLSIDDMIAVAAYAGSLRPSR
jgi:cytochrome c553